MRWARDAPAPHSRDQRQACYSTERLSPDSNRLSSDASAFLLVTEWFWFWMPLMFMRSGQTLCLLASNTFLQIKPVFFKSMITLSSQKIMEVCFCQGIKKQKKTLQFFNLTILTFSQLWFIKPDLWDMSKEIVFFPSELYFITHSCEKKVRIVRKKKSELRYKLECISLNWGKSQNYEKKSQNWEEKVRNANN